MRCPTDPVFAGIGSTTKYGDKLLTIAKDLKAHGVSKLGLYGLCWGSKVAGTWSVRTDTVPACGPSTPFDAYVQIHPSFVAPEDANNVSIPFASFTSKDESGEVVDAFLKNAAANPANQGKFVHHHYPENHHGFAAARANLNDPSNVASFQDVYQRTASFFLQHFK